MAGGLLLRIYILDFIFIILFIYMLIFSFEVVVVEADGFGNVAVVSGRILMLSLSFQFLFSVVVL